MDTPQRLKLRRTQFAVGLLMLLFGIIILALRVELIEWFHFLPSSVFAAGLSSLAYGIGFLMLLYLRGAIRFRLLDSFITLEADTESEIRSKHSLQPEIELLREQIREFEARIPTSALSESAISTEDRQQIIARLSENIGPTLANELEGRFKADYQRSEHLAQARDAFDTNARRLSTEIAALFRRSNLNLVIGVLTTTAAAALLYYTTVRAAPTFTDINELLSYYIPRIATVVFIEVFAFFFLRLYKASLSQAQHYQNELTRSALIEVALESAMRTQDNTILSAVLRDIARSQPKLQATSDGSKPGKNGVQFDLDAVKQIAELIKAARE